MFWWIVSDVKSRSSGISSLKKFILRFTFSFECLYPHHPFIQLFPSAISISHCNIDQIFNYQNKFCYISNCWLWSILLWKWYGWQDMESRSWWVLVGLICKSVSSCLYLSLKLAPKKFISSFDYSAVNLIMRWKPLSVSLHCLKISIFSMFLNKIYIINIPLPYALL